MSHTDPSRTIIGIALFQVRMKRLFRILYEQAEQRCQHAEGTIAVLEETLRSLMRRNRELEAKVVAQRELIETLKRRHADAGI